MKWYDTVVCCVFAVLSMYGLYIRQPWISLLLGVCFVGYVYIVYLISKRDERQFQDFQNWFRAHDVKSDEEEKENYNG